MKSTMQLLKYLIPYKRLAILGPLLMILEVMMDLIQPTIMQHIIDTGIAQKDHTYVISMGLLMIISAVLGLVGGIGCSIYSSRAAVHFSTDIRKDLFHHITRFSSSNSDHFGAGKLITIMTSDVETVQRALMMTLKIFVRGPLLFIGSIIIVFITARQFFLILSIIVPILVICMYFFTKASSVLFKKVQEAIDRVNTQLQENLAGIRVIKAFNRKKYQTDVFTAVNNQLTARNITADQFVGILMPLTLFVVNMGVVAALWLGAIKVDSGLMQVGIILAFINYLTIIMNGLMSSSNVLVQIARAFPSAGRIQEVLQTEITIENKDNAYTPIAVQGKVQFKNVSYSYSKNGEQVLKDISFVANPGDTIGIIGTTGSGKSTILKLIARLFDTDEGEIRIDDIPIRDFDLEMLRKSIGYIPQKATLFSGTIEENIQYGKDHASETDVQIAIRDACASGFVQALPNSYQHTLTQGATNLSGGQKQRLSIARAFVRKPAILILDDSTSAVDNLSENHIQKAIMVDYKECTTFIVSSKISSIIHADQILVMEDGNIVGMGKHAQLLKDNIAYQEIYATQVGKGGYLNESTSTI